MKRVSISKITKLDESVFWEINEYGEARKRKKKQREKKEREFSKLYSMISSQSELQLLYNLIDFSF